MIGFKKGTSFWFCEADHCGAAVSVGPQERRRMERHRRECQSQDRPMGLEAVAIDLIIDTPNPRDALEALLYKMGYRHARKALEDKYPPQE